MLNVPVLITAYNRPEKVAALIESLRQAKPGLIYFSVDGPKLHKKSDALKTKQVLEEVAKIDWKCDLRIRARKVNLGIRKAIPDAVDWVLSENECLVVLEEDVVVGPQALDFAKTMLEKYQSETRFGHISLYNVVPQSHLLDSSDQIRASIYPESVAWATWKRAWCYYDDEVRWGSFASLSDLKEITGSTLGAIKWKLNFLDARDSRISTWAYRWISTLWENGMQVISPNVNLVTYAGADEGSHTLTKIPWKELPIETMNLSNNDFSIGNKIVPDSWLSRHVFKETFIGIVKHFAVLAIRIFIPEKH